MSDQTEKKSIYTTIQVRRDINYHIRKLCKARGWLASTTTENFWVGLISSSVSGSYQAGG
jgi:hypothetical protein